MNDVALGWFVVPGVVASVLGSAFGVLVVHLSRKEIARLESRLRKQEETYRLAQSPRVDAATDLWSAFCKYERALHRALYPTTFEAYDGSEADAAPNTPEGQAQLLRAVADLRAAWRELTLSRDRAEILLPGNVFVACDDLFEAYSAAYDERWLGRMLGAPPGARENAVRTHLEEAVRRRPKALAALKTMIDTPDSAGSEP